MIILVTSQAIFFKKDPSSVPSTKYVAVNVFKDMYFELCSDHFLTISELFLTFDIENHTSIRIKSYDSYNQRTILYFVVHVIINK